MAKAALPSPDTLRQLLRYDPETGKLFWRTAGIEWFVDGKRSAISRQRHWNTRYPNTEALNCPSGNGYMRGNFRGKRVYAHRVIWAMTHNEWPNDEIDHIDLNRSNNRIENLRNAIRSENSWNSPPHKDNQSGMKGAYWDKRRKCWFSTIMKNGVTYKLGRFTSAEAAHNAYCEASKHLHEGFSRTSHNST